MCKVNVWRQSWSRRQQLKGETATSTIYMIDFGIQSPNLANIAIAQNKVLITIKCTAKEG
jgi:hypothetical protein